MEWDRVLEYIRACPAHIAPPNHPALEAAIQGIEQERNRQARDAKLKQKFAASSNSNDSALSNPNKRSNTASTPSTTAGSTPTQSRTTTTNPPVLGSHKIPKTEDPPRSSDTSNDPDEEAMVDDWHTVMVVGNSTDDNSHDTGANTSQTIDASKMGEPLASNATGNHGENSYLGQVLAQEAIRLVAHHKVEVKSPVAALTAVFHAALVSPYLEFVCTGVPPTKATSGFAPPIRPLKDVFLPKQWDDKPDSQFLRYRKEGLGSIVLTVAASDEDDATKVTPKSSEKTTRVLVTWTPTNSTMSSSATEPLATFLFELEDYVNLPSWNRASQDSTIAINPCLHFKSLAVLMSRWAQTLDLGQDASEGEKQTNMMTTAADLPSSVNPPQFDTTPQPVLPQPTPPIRPASSQLQDPSRREFDRGYEIPTRLDQAFPGSQPGMGGRGQFSDDLLPGGGTLPSFGTVPNSGGGGGNWMGPNHPVFGGASSTIPPGGFLQPRFDVYGPPPTQPANPHDPRTGPRRGGGPIPRPNGGGRPNDDHLRPPNDLNNNNMFL